jgi:predicted DNA-binding ribbon-helix-helix protein
MCHKINRYVRGRDENKHDEEFFDTLNKYYGDFLVETKHLIKRISEETGKPPNFTQVNRLSKFKFLFEVKL